MTTYSQHMNSGPARRNHADSHRPTPQFSQRLRSMLVLQLMCTPRSDKQCKYAGPLLLHRCQQKAKRVDYPNARAQAKSTASVDPTPFASHLSQFRRRNSRNSRSSQIGPNCPLVIDRNATLTYSLDASFSHWICGRGTGLHLAALMDNPFPYPGPEQRQNQHQVGSWAQR